MPKKTKSKARLDKYYQLAKEQGFRSRAAFKLVQINQKYNQLNNATAVIDLCAAPGSWLQVCSKYMPSSSILLGFDQDPIKPIPNVKSFIQDIMTPKCFSIIKRELHHFKADLVLNDGAPNVGQDWKKDAFGQVELVQASLKIACTFLRKGGNFCTKVFRSTDYNSQIWVMSKFFDRVEANKPDSSRNQSAEIFVVCLGFKAPDKIDERLFSIKHVFADTEGDFLTGLLDKEVNSIDKIFLKRRKRFIPDGTPLTMFKKISFEEYQEKRNPYAVFVEYNQITFSKEEEEKYSHVVKQPDDYKELMDDILIIGKREVGSLIKWRDRLKAKLRPKKEIEEPKADEEATADKSQKKLKLDKKQYDDRDDELLDQELEQAYLMEKKKEKTAQKEKEKRLQDFAKGGGGAKTAPIDDELDQDLIDFDFQKHAKLVNSQKMAEVEYPLFKTIENEGQHVYKKRETAPNTFMEMQDNVEYIYELKNATRNRNEQRQKAIEAEKKEKYDEKRNPELTDKRIQEFKYDSLKDRRHKKRVGTMHDEEEGHDENQNVEQELEEKVEEDPLKKRLLQNYDEEDGADIQDLKQSRWFDRDIFDVLNKRKKLKGMSDDKVEKKTEFKNTKKNFEDSEDDTESYKEDSESEEYDGDVGEKIDSDDDRSEMDIDEIENDIMGGMDLPDKPIEKKDKKKLQNKHRNKDGDDSEDADPFADDDYDGKHDQIYPKSDKEKRQIQRKKDKAKEEKKELKLKKQRGEEGIVTQTEIEFVKKKTIDDYEEEELAKTQALARKMIRKKDRDAILDASINKQNMMDEDEDLPEWFKTDEKRHVYKSEPVTKEETANERERLKEFNNRESKKVMEAKWRKKKRAASEMKKFKNKADQIFEQEAVDERSKIRQVGKAFAGAKRKINKQKEKKIVHGKKSTAVGGANTTGRKFRMVDARGKKDMRAEKRAERKKKGVREPKGKKGYRRR